VRTSDGFIQYLDKVNSLSYTGGVGQRSFGTWYRLAGHYGAVGRAAYRNERKESGMRPGRVTRRQMLKGIGGVGFGSALLAACGGSSTGSLASTSASALASASSTLTAAAVPTTGAASSAASSVTSSAAAVS